MSESTLSRLHSFKNAISSSDLRKTFNHIITFTAKRLQPYHVQIFGGDASERFYIRGDAITKAIHNALNDNPRLGAHTDIHLFLQGTDSDAVEVKRYWWTHYTIAPYGILIPFNCPKCHCNKTIEAVFSEGMFFVCTANLLGGIKCGWTEKPVISQAQFDRGRGSEKHKEGRWFYNRVCEKDLQSFTAAQTWSLLYIYVPSMDFFTCNQLRQVFPWISILIYFQMSAIRQFHPSTLPSSSLFHFFLTAAYVFSENSAQH